MKHYGFWAILDFEKADIGPMHPLLPKIESDMPDTPMFLRPARRKWLDLTFAVVLTALALLIRLWDLNVFVTTDEPKWASRSILFYQGLAQGRFEQTYQVGHPGVMTMWLGVPGMDLDSLLAASAEAPFGQADLIFAGRRGVAVVTGLMVGVAFLLLVRLLGRPVALLAGTFILLDPFFLAHSRVLHVDALAAGFLFLYLLSLAVALRERKRRFMVLSGIFAGLAMLSKSPAMIAMPFTALLIGLQWLVKKRPGREVISSGLIWLVSAVAIYFLLWPAMWVQPLTTFRAVLDTALGYAGEPHSEGNFFWGMPRPDPGPAFYPVALIFRLTPWATLGALLSLPWAMRRRGSLSAQDVGLDASSRPILWMLWAFALLFMAFMTVAGKKGDRYVLPIFPCLQVIAALGFLLALSWLRHRFGWFRKQSALQVPMVVAASLILGIATVLPHAPYYLTYFNPLVGGTGVAVRAVAVGWGEGLDLAADFLNSTPGIGKKHTCTGARQTLKPMLRGEVDGAGSYDPVKTNYVVLYLNEIQRGLNPDLLSRYYGVAQPIYVARLGGTEYAWVYENKSYEAPLAYIQAHGDPATDAIVVSRDGLFADNYHGSFPLYVLNNKWQEADLQHELQRISAGARRVWYVRYAEKKPVPVLDWADREWQEHTVLLEDRSFTDIGLSLRQINDNAFGANAGPSS